MEINLYRYSDNGESTQGLLFINGKFECYTLEDEHRDVKVKGETRIPCGRYKVDFRKAASDLTLKYREKYPWFTYHLMLHDVPNFKYVYIHVGNTSKSSEGCILTQSSIQKSGKKGEAFNGGSVAAFTDMYKMVSPILKNEGEVYITIHDEGLFI